MGAAKESEALQRDGTWPSAAEADKQHADDMRGLIDEHSNAMKSLQDKLEADKAKKLEKLEKRKRTKKKQEMRKLEANGATPEEVEAALARIDAELLEKEAVIDEAFHDERAKVLDQVRLSSESNSVAGKVID